MLEKTNRLVVNQETKKIIDDIVEGIEERLSAEPSWTTNLIERLGEKIAARPEWDGPIEKSLLSVVKHESAQVGKELQKLKVDVGSVIPRLDQTAAAVSEVANIITRKANGDLTKRDFRQAIGKVVALLQAIKEDNDKTREATIHNLSLLQTRIAEQQTMIETLCVSGTKRLLHRRVNHARKNKQICRKPGN
jgi:hypothetical protein